MPAGNVTLKPFVDYVPNPVGEVNVNGVIWAKTNVLSTTEFAADDTTQGATQSTFTGCPTGWRLPTKAEFAALFPMTVAVVGNMGYSYSKMYPDLKFPHRTGDNNTGYRDSQGSYGTSYWNANVMTKSSKIEAVNATRGLVKVAIIII